MDLTRVDMQQVESLYLRLSKLDEELLKLLLNLPPERRLPADGLYSLYMEALLSNRRLMNFLWEQWWLARLVDDPR